MFSPVSSRIQNFSYRPEIDGLRALAVLAVIMFHAKIALSGGYLGVDVFFVISGYLITSLIIKELQKGTFTFVAFWERRIRRIVPATSVMVVAVLVAGWFLLLPNEYVALGKSAMAFAAIVANIYFWRNTSGYFANGEEMPLLHTWSLAVEEQFYLIMPLFPGCRFQFICASRSPPPSHCNPVYVWKPGCEHIWSRRISRRNVLLFAITSLGATYRFDSCFDSSGLDFI